LRAKVGDVADPVGALDARDSLWRERLPLDVADDTARFLFQRLFRDAARLARRPRGAPLRLERLLVQSAEGLRLEARVELASLIEPRALADIFGVDHGRLPDRGELVMVGDDSSTSRLGYLTLIHS